MIIFKLAKSFIAGFSITAFWQPSSLETPAWIGVSLTGIWKLRGCWCSSLSSKGTSFQVRGSATAKVRSATRAQVCSTLTEVTICCTDLSCQTGLYHSNKLLVAVLRWALWAVQTRWRFYTSDKPRKNICKCSQQLLNEHCSIILFRSGYDTIPSSCLP